MKLFWITLLTVSLLCTLALAGAPNLINYGGRLTDGLGNPVPNGTYSVTFTIYDAPTGGVPQWGETQSVTTAGGLFNVLLGSNILFATTLFDDTTLYLGIAVGADPELTPRTRLTSVPFALSAAVGGGWEDDGSAVRLHNVSDYVGIGTSTPLRPLHVSDPAGGLFVSRMESSSSDATVSEFANTSAGSVWELSVAGSAGIPFWGVQPGDLYFYRQGTPWPNAVLTSTGGLGLGTAMPRARLEAVTLDTIAGLFLSAGPTPATKVLHAEYTGTGSFDAVAVYGKSIPGDYYGIGGMFEGGYQGVIGQVTQSGGGSYTGVQGNAFGDGAGYKYGVYGRTGGLAGAKYGLYGRADGPSATGAGATADGLNATGLFASAGGSGTNYGVYALSTGAGTNYGLYALATGGTVDWAGYFTGNVHVNGTFSKSAGSFRIDHPLDPENKYLQHSFVESPDMMNVYNGNVLLDGNGAAVVVLPAYFESLNRDFRYQLSCIGGFAPVYVSSEVADNRFSIAGGTPGLKVSWQVTGVRRDAYAEAHRIQVEVVKTADERGKYAHPEAFGKSEERGIGYQMRKEMRERELNRPVPGKDIAETPPAGKSQR